MVLCLFFCGYIDVAIGVYEIYKLVMELMSEKCKTLFINVINTCCEMKLMCLCLM